MNLLNRLGSVVTGGKWKAPGVSETLTVLPVLREQLREMAAQVKKL